MPEGLQIIAGGQTGADRAALDWAIERDWPTGGWCPAGRRAEDGIIPLRYPLKETSDSAYIVRTRANVRDSDATVIFSIARRLEGGSRDTAALAEELDRPCLHLACASWPRATDAAAKLANFVSGSEFRVLHLAGPRASEEPGIGDWVTKVLDFAFPTDSTQVRN